MAIQLFFKLLAGHYLADFALQTRFMSETKHLAFKESIGFHVLTAHAFIHGLVAGLFSGSYIAGVIIGVSHWLIDLRVSDRLTEAFGKKDALFGINADQALHVTFIVIATLVVV